MNSRPLFSRTITLVGAALLAASASAAVFDGGVDSANLGKGDWIYFVSAATNQLGGNVPAVTNIASLMSYEKSQGIEYIIVKCGTGSTNFNGGGASPQFNSNLVYRAHAAGLKIFGYTRSYGSDVQGEIDLATYCFNLGADGFVIDAEAEWESHNPWIGANGPAKAIQLCSGIKALWPTKFLAHAPMPIISYHSSFPYKEFGYYCDAVMPQIYHYSFDMTPSAAIDWTDTEWNNFHNSLTGIWTNAIKPIAPVGQVYGPLSPPQAAAIPNKDVTEFVDYLSCDPNSASPGGYKGVNFWRADLHGAVQWDNIKKSTIGNFAGVVNNIVIDNPQATVVGTWTTATIATNEFGVNYRYKGQGTGAAYLEFRPNIVVAGDYEVYEWHTIGANRSTAVPHEVVYNGGSTTVNVNQQLNDARWRLVGSYSFASGTAGYVRIKDSFTDAGQVAIADAVKFVYAGPTLVPPAAPSGLAATPVRATRIDLTWVDNSSDETNFVLARSTTAGGPYTDVATLAANTTSYNNTGLTADTTYYYVVRAVGPGGTSPDSAEASATTFETNLLVDNKSALVVGAWSTGTSATDKYSTDYRFITQGSGANYLQFTPYVATAAAYDVLEWHAQGNNRTTNAPHVITHDAGTTTIYKNQKVNGGKWNYLGTFNFPAGNVGKVKITDGFPDATQVVMADAIKFSLAPAPTAPTGLSATPTSASRINLSWTDTSTNETEFVVRRSTTSGGPYSDIVVLPANTTSYGNTNLAANTTYYYVVRAANASGASANSVQASAKTHKAVHVHSITMSWVLSSGKYKSRAVVNVKDQSGVNVNAATVTGNFTGAISESGKTGVTGTGGSATITSTASILSGNVTFTVTGITGTAMTYSPSDNVVTSATHSR
jgi:hypothetical protein